MVEDDPDVVERVLQYMYTLQYSDEVATSPEDIESYQSSIDEAIDETSDSLEASTSPAADPQDSVERIPERYRFSTLPERDHTFRVKAVPIHLSLMMNVRSLRYGG